MLAVWHTTEEALFVANEKEVLFHGMDPSHVSLVLIDWPSSDFKSYECEGSVRIGIRADMLKKIVDNLPKKSDVEMTVDETMLTLSSGKTKFKIKLLEVDDTPRQIPKFETSVEFTIDSKKLHTHMTNIGTCAENVKFKADDDMVTLHGTGDSGGVDIETDIEPERGESDEVEPESTYSLEYLEPFVKDMNGDITLKFGDNKPVILNCGHVTLMVANRVA